MSHIELLRVGKTFGDRVIVREVYLQIEKEERLVLFGPSGCGKTTILRLVAGLDIPDTGEIRIGNQIVATAEKNVVPPEQRNLAMVFQDLALWPHMTVAENLMFGLRARGVAGNEASSRVSDMLQRVGLANRLSAKPHQLSGGEQQRVALARALVLRPSILLMDEPLSNLDEDRKHGIIHDLLDLQRQFRFTLIYVTHDRSEADMLGSRICYLRDGVVDLQTPRV